MEALNIIHKLITNKQPPALECIYKRGKRSTANIHFNYIPKTNKLRQFFLYRGLDLYNSLQTNYKSLTIKKFKEYLKENRIKSDQIYVRTL